MLINLSFIKAVNGLFYFALDYIEELQDIVSTVLVRSPELATAVSAQFPSLSVRVANSRQAARAIWSAARRREMTFTPSSHPIPWAKRQLVVVHDTFPFEGLRGRAKAALFFCSTYTSGATVGYVNRSDSGAFLSTGGLTGDRVLFTPNRPSAPRVTSLAGSFRLPARPVIGLLGTDSPKKNYDALFQQITEMSSCPPLDFRLYGKLNEYASNLVERFPLLGLTIIDSQSQEIEEFLCSVDIVVSAATREGYSRPTAMALSRGVPCWVVDAPVFQEFYRNAATFFRSGKDLAQALLHAPQSTIMRPERPPSNELDVAFLRAVAWLRNRDGARA